MTEENKVPLMREPQKPYRTPSVVNVRDLRRERGMTLDDLAEASGLSSRTIAACEGDDPFWPSVKESTVRALAEALGVSKHDITCGPEEGQILRDLAQEERMPRGYS